MKRQDGETVQWDIGAGETNCWGSPIQIAGDQDPGDGD